MPQTTYKHPASGTDGGGAMREPDSVGLHFFLAMRWFSDQQHHQLLRASCFSALKCTSPKFYNLDYRGFKVTVTVIHTRKQPLMTARPKARIKSSVGAAFYPCCAFGRALGSEGSALGASGTVGNCRPGPARLRQVSNPGQYHRSCRRNVDLI